jgi:hypothetical protein
MSEYRNVRTNDAVKTCKKESRKQGTNQPAIQIRYKSFPAFGERMVPLYDTLIYCKSNDRSCNLLEYEASIETAIQQRCICIIGHCVVHDS